MHGGSCICTVRRVQDSLDKQRPTPLYACALPHGPQIHAVGCGRGQGNTRARSLRPYARFEFLERFWAKPQFGNFRFAGLL